MANQIKTDKAFIAATQVEQKEALQVAFKGVDELSNKFETKLFDLVRHMTEIAKDKPQGLHFFFLPL